MSAGPGRSGTVYEMSPPTVTNPVWTFTTLYSFTNGGDGGRPMAALIQDGQGNLYGTATQGGQYGRGTVYELSPPTPTNPSWTFTTLYSFTGGSDGGFPVAGLMMDDQSNLYGTATQGGQNTPAPPHGGILPDGGSPGGYGTVYELSPPTAINPAWTFTSLHSFVPHSDGAGPIAGVIMDSQGNLFGTAASAGPGGAGTVYELTAPAASPQPTTLALPAVSSDLVTPATFKATLTQSVGATPVPNESITFNAAWHDCTGNHNVVLGSATTDSTGLATLSLLLDPNSFKMGTTYTLDANFLGDPDFDASFATTTLTITRTATLLVTSGAGSQATPILVGSTVPLTATLTRADGVTPLPNAPVSFSLAGTTFHATTNVAGVASVNYTVPSGMFGHHVLTVHYAGSGIFQPSTGSGGVYTARILTTLTVPDVTGKKGTTVTLSATLTETSSGLPITGATLTLKVGATVLTAVTDSTGNVSVPYTLPNHAGTQHATVHYAGSGEYQPIPSQPFLVIATP